MKICSKCKLELEDKWFKKRKREHGGLSSYCKLCIKIYSREYNRKNFERRKIYRKLNKDSIKNQKAQYYLSNKEKINARNRAYYHKYKNERALQKKEYRKTERGRGNKVKYEIYQYRNNPQYKLKKLLRRRVQLAIKIQGSGKTGSAVKDLGITIPEFKEYIESLFRDGMTWENHGKYWHLDHVKPLASFNLTDREQFLIAANWKNYQPLLVFENLSKNCKYN